MNIPTLWKGTAVTAVAAAAAMALGLASFQSASADDHAYVRVMHASPDTPAVDIFVDGEAAVEALAFPNDTGYVELPAGAHNVQVFVSPSDGSGDPALEADLELAVGGYYTVLATGLLEDGSLSLLPLEDNVGQPEAGNAHVRLIHASPDAPAVNVLVAGTDTEVFSDVEFNDAQGPTPVPAGSYDLEVALAADGTVALEVPGVALADSAVYTFVATGLAGDGSLAVQALVDAEYEPAGSDPEAPHTGTGLAGTDSGMTAAWLAIAGAAIAVAGGTGIFALRRR